MHNDFHAAIVAVGLIAIVAADTITSSLSSTTPLDATTRQHSDSDGMVHQLGPLTNDVLEKEFERGEALENERYTKHGEIDPGTVLEGSGRTQAEARVDHPQEEAPVGKNSFFDFGDMRDALDYCYKTTPWADPGNPGWGWRCDPETSPSIGNTIMSGVVKSALKGKKLMMNGDSLMREFKTGFLCALSGNNPPGLMMKPDLQSQWGAPGTSDSFQLVHHNKDILTMQVRGWLEWGTDVLVLSFGIWYNFDPTQPVDYGVASDYTTKMAPQCEQMTYPSGIDMGYYVARRNCGLNGALHYISDLKRLAEVLNKERWRYKMLRKKWPLVVWQSVTPQHFNTGSGMCAGQRTYQSETDGNKLTNMCMDQTGNRPIQCAPIEHPDQGYARNRIVETVLRLSTQDISQASATMQPVDNVINVYWNTWAIHNSGPMSRRLGGHLGTGAWGGVGVDCTHFCIGGPVIGNLVVSFANLLMEYCRSIPFINNASIM